MGKSAKVHKRIGKKLKSGALTATNSVSAASTPQTQVQAAKKRSKLKGKSNNDKGSESSVLGGADYLSLLMGSRKKAMEEAKKLPRED